jgi:hypothetical protein
MQAQITAEPAKPPSADGTYHPAWNSLPTLVWATVLVIALLVFKRELRQFFQMINRRLRLGASLKFGTVEIGQTYVDPSDRSVHAA